MTRFKKLGDILLSEEIITEDQLSQAVKLQKKQGGKLGEVLIGLNYITEEQIAVTLSKQLSLPHVLDPLNLKSSLESGLEDLIPYEFAIRNLVLPLFKKGHSLSVVMTDPLDFMLLDNLKKLTGVDIEIIVSTRSCILTAIDSFYGRDKMFRDAVASTGEQEGYIKEISAEETDLSLDKLIGQAEQAPVVKLVDLIIRQAIEDGASDIHIEPHHDKLSLRYRVDGRLYDKPSPALSLYLSVISRIKILSRMDIAEKRLPQDGGFMVKIGERLVDLRVSTLPTIYGEKVVLRILDKSRVPLDLLKLGFLPEELELIKKGISSAYGLVFLTGPTGSGKSTTLYAVLNQLQSSTHNILSAEDPVEYRISDVNQVQIKPEIGLTFANILRCFLRQDPDIILVGEIRDLETAEICVRAALTGHLVLSTLHTNDATSTVNRLIDIGIPPYLVVSSLRLIVAQRLVRKLCPHCKESYQTKREDIPKGVVINSPNIYIAKGCKQCNFIGYRGRTLIAEIILVNDAIRDAIHNNSLPSEIMKIARDNGSYTLLESGIKRVEQGIVSLEEVLSVVTVY